MPNVAARNSENRRPARRIRLVEGAIQKKFRYRNCITSVRRGVMNRSAQTQGCTPKILPSMAMSESCTSWGFTNPIVSCRFV
jgi:hypothetical protein